MLKFSFLAVFISFSSLSFAGAKTYSYSVDEINAVLKSDVVKNAISDKGRARVTSIAKEDFTYSISTSNGCVSSFNVMYNGLPMPGAPAIMDVQLVETNCIPSGGVVGH